MDEADEEESESDEDCVAELLNELMRSFVVSVELERRANEANGSLHDGDDVGE